MIVQDYLDRGCVPLSYADFVKKTIESKDKTVEWMLYRRTSLDFVDYITVKKGHIPALIVYGDYTDIIYFVHNTWST
jgi:hypothetical protein